MFDIYEALINKDEELQIYHYGMQKCENGHHYGPAVRDHFLIHFILDGKGIFKVGDSIYKLSKNQAFLIVPDVVTYYQADFYDPWTYCWIGFNGIKAYPILKEANFTFKNPIFNYDDSCLIIDYMQKILEDDVNVQGSMLKRKAYLYLVLSEILRINSYRYPASIKTSQKEMYIEKAIDFINRNYSIKFKISDIAKFIGLDRSYFSALFKECINMSPQEYILNFKVKKAADLLNTTCLSVGDIARSVGYEDPLGFSKVFKKVMGISPLKYRQKLFH